MDINNFKRMENWEQLDIIEEIFDCYFNGEPNMVTPDILWFAKMDINDETLMMEVSKGKDYFDKPSFGLTTLVMDNEGIIQRIDLNKFFLTLDELIRHMNDISSDMFYTADRYGEAKHLNTMKNII